jgi:hypothetical protein
MGVDVLIAVDVSFPLALRDGLGSALDVTNQMIGIMVRRGTRESRALLGAGDVLIEPDLGRMTASTSLGAAGDGGGRDGGGRGAARNSRRCRCRRSSYAATTPHRSAGATSTSRSSSCGGPEVAGRRRAHRGRVRRPRRRAARSPTLQRKLGRQYGLDRFESVDYRLVRDGASSGSRSTCAASRGARTSCASASASSRTTTAAPRPTPARGC